MDPGVMRGVLKTDYNLTQHDCFNSNKLFYEKTSFHPF